MFIAPPHVKNFTFSGCVIISTKQEFNTLASSLSEEIKAPHKSSTLKECIARSLGLNSVNHLLANLPVLFNKDLFIKCLTGEINSNYAVSVPQNYLHDYYEEGYFPENKVIDEMREIVETGDDGHTFFPYLDFQGDLEGLNYRERWAYTEKGVRNLLDAFYPEKLPEPSLDLNVFVATAYVICGLIYDEENA